MPGPGSAGALRSSLLSASCTPVSPPSSTGTSPATPSSSSTTGSSRSARSGTGCLQMRSPMTCGAPSGSRGRNCATCTSSPRSTAAWACSVCSTTQCIPSWSCWPWVPADLVVTSARVTAPMSAELSTAWGKQLCHGGADWALAEKADGTAVDIFSFGMCALEMAVLEIQTNGDTRVSEEAIVRARHSLDDPNMREFILSCLTLNPDKRPTANSLLFHRVLFEVHSLKLLAAHCFINNQYLMPENVVEEKIKELDLNMVMAEIRREGRPGAQWRYSEVSFLELDKFLEDVRNGIYPLMNFAVSRPHALPRALSQPQEDPQKVKTPTPEPFDVETRKYPGCGPGCCWPGHVAAHVLPAAHHDPRVFPAEPVKLSCQPRSPSPCPCWGLFPPRGRSWLLSFADMHWGDRAVGHPHPGRAQAWRFVQQRPAPELRRQRSDRSVPGSRERCGDRPGTFEVVQMQCSMELNEDKTQWHLTLLLILEDKLHRQLSYDLLPTDNSKDLATELVHYGFIHEDDCEKLANFLENAFHKHRSPPL
ncbi:nuclear receptor-binding protein 2 isoform 8-T10 [Podargus strigoides]